MSEIGMESHLLTGKTTPNYFGGNLESTTDRYNVVSTLGVWQNKHCPPSEHVRWTAFSVPKSDSDMVSSIPLDPTVWIRYVMEISAYQSGDRRRQ